MAGKKKDNNDNSNVIKKETIIQQPMEEIMHNSIMPYAEYVILERALPRVEDGLKPVQRRILYTMYELGLTPDKPHRKSARIVGDTLGKYHPHGDTSIYDAMVRMAQNFNMRHKLVDGHGNFGSVDGDSAAAMRYTEARMTPLALELLRDIEKDTVHFSLNFDDTLKEPDLLPGRFPNLLVNGCSGIAVGLATNIPSHNLGEVIDGVIAQIDNPDIELKQLMKYVKGPDFPTGGYIIGKDEIIKAYETGKGKITVRADVDIENLPNGKKQLVINEIPYQVNKANMLQKIVKLRDDRKGILGGISDVRDESDRNGMRAVIEIKKDADAEKILNYLYKYSELQVTFGINMVAIADGKPQTLGLKAINRYYINHQKDVVTRRTKFDLEKAKTRAHILNGLILAINNIDRVIKIIKSSKTVKAAKKNLIDEFKFSDIQAQAILDMRLQRLTGLEIENLEKEYNELLKFIKNAEEILSSEQKLLDLIKKELKAVKSKYADKRKTKLMDQEEQIEIIDDFEVIEDAYVVMTDSGYIKRLSEKSYTHSNKENDHIEGNDYVKFIVKAKTDQKILFFTDKGNCFTKNCKDIAEGKWKDKGKNIYNDINGLNQDEKIIKILTDSDFNQGIYLNFYTKNGYMKKTSFDEYNTRKSKILACGLKDDDRIINIEVYDKEKNIICITKNGMSIHFDQNGINSVGRSSIGVISIKLKENDYVIFEGQVSDEGEIAVLSDKCYIKKILISDFEMQNRAGKGVKVFDFINNKENGSECIYAFYVKEAFDIYVNLTGDKTVSINTDSIPIMEKSSSGNEMIVLESDEKIIDIHK